MSKKRAVSMSKRQIMKQERSKRQRQQRITTLIAVIVVALIVVAVLVYPTIKTALAPVGSIVKITPQPRPMASLNAMGDPNAPVKITEYSDFQCPYCKRFSDETEKQIVDTYVATGKVYFVYVPYGPGGNYIGPESKAAAMAAFCAGDQGKFWEFHDILFANQTGENVGDYKDKRLLAFAETLSLDMTKFRSCFDGNQFAQKLQEGLTQGQQAGVGGTPYFLINGTPVEGAQPFENFKQVIDTALGASGG
jgi:protein-disulfide isomerase